jgi:uncharacterized protein (TIGR02996 family)
MADLKAAFLETIRREPYWDEHRLIYADWLEEQGSPLARLLRLHPGEVWEEFRGLFDSRLATDADAETLREFLLAHGQQPWTLGIFEHPQTGHLRREVLLAVMLHLQKQDANLWRYLVRHGEDIQWSSLRFSHRHLLESFLLLQQVEDLSVPF